MSLSWTSIYTTFYNIFRLICRSHTSALLTCWITWTMWYIGDFKKKLALPMMSSSGLKLWNSLCRRVKFCFASACLIRATTTSVGVHVQRASTYKNMHNKLISCNAALWSSGCTFYCPDTENCHWTKPPHFVFINISCIITILVF